MNKEIRSGTTANNQNFNDYNPYSEIPMMDAMSFGVGSGIYR